MNDPALDRLVGNGYRVVVTGLSDPTSAMSRARGANTGRFVAAQVVASGFTAAGALAAVFVLARSAPTAELSRFIATFAVSGFVFGGAAGAANLTALLSSARDSKDLSTSVLRRLVIRASVASTVATLLSTGMISLTEGSSSLLGALLACLNQGGTLVAGTLASAELGRRRVTAWLVLSIAYGGTFPIALVVFRANSSTEAIAISAILQIVVTAAVALPVFRRARKAGGSRLPYEATIQKGSSLLPTAIASAAMLALTRVPYLVLKPTAALAALFVALRVMDAFRLGDSIAINSLLTMRVSRTSQAPISSLASMQAIGTVMLPAMTILGIVLAITSAAIIPIYVRILGLHANISGSLLLAFSATLLLDSLIWSYHYAFIRIERATLNAVALLIGLILQASMLVVGENPGRAVLIGVVVTLAIQNGLAYYVCGAVSSLAYLVAICGALACATSLLSTALALPIDAVMIGLIALVSRRSISDWRSR